MFLEAFVDKDIPWVHLDIAAADLLRNKELLCKGCFRFRDQDPGNALNDDVKVV